MKFIRPLFCPICGAKVEVPVTGNLPEVHRLPDHWPAPDALNAANLCAGLVVTVTISYDTCNGCGCNIYKNSSGLCLECYSKRPAADFCAYCGANVPPIRGEGTCPKCDPDGCRARGRTQA